MQPKQHQQNTKILEHLLPESESSDIGRRLGQSFGVRCRNRVTRARAIMPRSAPGASGRPFRRRREIQSSATQREDCARYAAVGSRVGGGSRGDARGRRGPAHRSPARPVGYGRGAADRTVGGRMVFFN